MKQNTLLALATGLGLSLVVLLQGCNGSNDTATSTDDSSNMSAPADSTMAPMNDNASAPAAPAPAAPEAAPAPAAPEAAPAAPAMDNTPATPDNGDGTVTIPASPAADGSSTGATTIDYGTSNGAESGAEAAAIDQGAGSAESANPENTDSTAK